jgi:hypothetical protein
LGRVGGWLSLISAAGLVVTHEVSGSRSFFQKFSDNSNICRIW